MNEWFLAFTLGNAAILTNACMLPLYPGLIAFLAGNSGNERSRSATGWLGALVLAGILSMMVLIGLIITVFSLSFGNLFSILLPAIYGLVILLGVLMLLGRNPFVRLQTARTPALKNPYLTAYVYGLLFGPMTLPCTGPIIVSAFTVGSGAADIAQGLAYFFFFGLGFGWPLVVLPMLALPFQRQIVGWLARQHHALNQVSGALLIAVGVFGILTELIPQVRADWHLDLTAQLLYWLTALLIASSLGYRALNRAG